MNRREYRIKLLESLVEQSCLELNKSRVRLLLIFLLCYLIGLSLSCLGFLYWQIEQQKAIFSGQVINQFKKIRPQISQYIVESNRQDINRSLRTLDILGAQFWTSSGKPWYEFGYTLNDANGKVSMSLWQNKRPIGAVVMEPQWDQFNLKVQALKWNVFMFACGLFVLTLIAFYISFSIVYHQPLTFIYRIIKQEISDLEAELSGSQKTRSLNFISKEILALRNRLRSLSQIHQRQIDELQQKNDQISKKLFDKQSSVVKLSLHAEKLESHDALTGVYSRTHFENVLNNEIELALNNSENYCIMVVDLNLKHINEHYGIKQGNQFLVQLATILDKNKQRTDRVFRIASNQFAIISKNSVINEINLLAQYFLKHSFETIKNLKEFLGDIHIGTVSTQSGMHFQNSENFFNCALTALHYAHIHNKSIVHFGDIMQKLNAVNVSKFSSFKETV